MIEAVIQVPKLKDLKIIFKSIIRFIKKGI